MTHAKRFGAAVIVYTAVALTAATFAAHTVTVGHMVQEVAKIKSVNATDPQTALASLRAAGTPLRSDLDLRKPLTQGDVVEIARQLGLRVTTQDPSAEFTSVQLDRFMSSFGGELATGDNPGQGSGPGNGQSGPPFDPFTKARGKGLGKAKFNRSPSE